MLTTDQLTAICNAEIERAGMRPLNAEHIAGLIVVRIKAPNNVTIGSVTLSEKIGLVYDEAEITDLIHAKVMEAVRAAIQEPGAKA